MIRQFVSSILIGFLLSSLSYIRAQERESSHPEKTIQAVWVNHPPKIDGVLDDAVWQEAPVATGFTQRDPNEGKPATEKTTFQVAYDDEALYVGVVCYDNEPGRIVSRLARRDYFIDREVDRITVLLDPYHDHQTGYLFMVYASGTMVDAAISDDSRFDWTWDGVWQAKTAIHQKGWSLEYKIPYHVLRFSPKEEYTWGMNVDRVISRKNENCYWVLRPKNKSGVASRFGHLEGIKGIRPPKHLEFLPFTLAQTTFESESVIDPNGREFFSSAGLDLRYGVSSNLSLNTTFNPDFGQVEADPAVLNLSVFETFFEERRPFFVEGAQFFRTPIGLFYSRRIGRRPGLLKIPAGSSEIDRPAATTILGAAKLTGKTKSKTSIGILNAVTAVEYATIETQSGRREHRIEPMTNYFVSRLQQDILDGNSTVGALATAVNSDVAPAYTGGLDWNLRWRNNSYRFLGQVAGSRAGRLEIRQSGYAMQMQLAKQSGWVWGDFGFEAFSPEFNANDIGFIRRVNRLSPSLRIQLRKIKPWGPFHQIYLNTLGSFAWNYRHKWTEKLYRWVNLEKALSFDISAQLKNFWWLKSGLTHHFERMDDLDTRGGPLIVKPQSTYPWVFLQGDDRLAIIPNLFFELTRLSDGGFGGNLAPSVRVKPASNVEFNIGPSYSWNLNKAQWITNVDDDGDGMPEHYVYGELESHIFDLTTRVNVTFTPNFSIQFYMQPFVAVGDYQKIKELARPSSYEFTPYTALNFNPDFSRRSLRSNLVFRWEYRQGSTLFLVWSQDRSKSLDTTNPRFEPLHNLRNSFTDEGQNIFLVKLNYWLGI